MALIVTKVSHAFYTAMVSPPHTREAWKTEEPLRMHQLCNQLLVLGLHQSDIGDAINQADREWLQKTLEIRRKPQPGEMVMLREVRLGCSMDCRERTRTLYLTSSANQFG